MQLANIQITLNMASAVLLGLFLLLVSPFLVNSDSAATILLADELVKAGTLLSKDWVYVSDSLSLDGRVQVAMLGAALWGASVKAFVFTAIAGAGFALWACYSLARLLQASRVNAGTAGLLLVLGPSLIYQDMVIGLGISMQMGLVLLFVAALIRYAYLGGNAFQLLIALAIAFLMSTSSPKKAVAYVLMPAMAAIALQLLLMIRAAWSHEVSCLRRMQWILPALAVTTLAGYFLHVELLNGLLLNSSYAKLDLILTPAHVLGNIETAGTLYARFAGAGAGIIALATVLGTTIALGVILAAPFSQRRRQFFVGADGFVYLYAVLGALGIIGYLLTYEEIKIYYGIYYLLIPISPLLAVAARIASGPHGYIGRGIGAEAVRVTLMVMLFFGAINAAQALLAFPEDYFGISKNQKTTHREQLEAIAWLRDEGLQHGFANYWDANSMTLLSDGALQVASALTPAGGRDIRRHAWLSSTERINFIPKNERWFVALPIRRRAVSMPKACVPADAEVEVGGYRIFVYSGTVRGCLPPPFRLRRVGKDAGRKIAASG
jgi:hypothetical protein